MNGIIFQGKRPNVGCTATFLFEPEITSESVKAIAEFNSGEKAYAEIRRDTPARVVIRVGEYYDGKGKRILERSWMLSYNQDLETWQIIKSLS